MALGEVMLRLDPGEERIASARSFRAWEGGGEYNVARGLRSCFAQRTAIVTRSPTIRSDGSSKTWCDEGGVDLSWLRWVPYDGVGRSVRNGLNFTERGFGPRAAGRLLGSGQLRGQPNEGGDVTGTTCSCDRGVRWFHTGSSSPLFHRRRRSRRRGDARGEEIRRRRLLRRQRPGLPVGGRGRNARAVEVNRHLVSLCDVVFGNEKNFVEALGVEVLSSGILRRAIVGERASWRTRESLPRRSPTFASSRRPFGRSTRRHDTTGAVFVGPTASLPRATSCPRLRSSTGWAGVTRSPRE